jgi:hypothetical protein
MNDKEWTRFLMSNPKDGGYFVTHEALNLFLFQERPKKNLCRRVSDTEFIVALKENPVYRGIDIDGELGRMDAWLLAHPERQKTRKFIVNWLNKHKPVTLQPINKKPLPRCEYCEKEVPPFLMSNHIRQEHRQELVV